MLISQNIFSNSIKELKLTLELDKNGAKYTVSLKGHLISIPLYFSENSEPGLQPRHFGAKPATKVPMRSGDFVGDVSRGGSCNAFEVKLNPHCNGTHTETSWHIGNAEHPPISVSDQLIYFAKLITVTPQKFVAGDDYSVQLDEEDLVIGESQIKKAIGDSKNIEALVVRTFPNSELKKTANWGEDIPSPFFTKQAAQFIQSINIKHLLVDFPSVDKLYDDGHLMNHKIFFDGDIKTITEMVYVSNYIKDGDYALSIGVAPFVLDAAPSDVRLYELTEQA